jgi:hypothetical protein
MSQTKSCKVCDSESKLIFRRGWLSNSQTFPYYCCTNRGCRFLFTDCLDDLSDTQVAEVYASQWDSMSSEGSSSRALDKVNLTKSLVPKVSSVFDLGSGKGWGVDALRKAGFEAYGYDVTPPKVCADYITVGNREAVVGTYDIITAIEVFEHLIDPIEVCQWVASLMEEGSIFVFTTSTFNPNKHDINWWYLDVVGHVSLHTRASLKCLAESTGFKVISDIWSTHVWIRGDQVPPGAAMRLQTNHILSKLSNPLALKQMLNLIKLEQSS